MNKLNTVYAANTAHFMAADLIAALDTAARIIEKAYENFLTAVILQAGRRNTLDVTATDCDMVTTVSIQASSIDPNFRALLPGKELSRIIKAASAKGGEILLRTEAVDEAPVVVAVIGGLHLRLAGVRENEETIALRASPTKAAWPHNMSFVDAANKGNIGFTLPAEDLRALLKQTSFAISAEETRYYLNGIYMHAVTVGGALKLRAVATDGHVLARHDVPAPDGAEAMCGVIIPRKTVVEIERVINRKDAPQRCTISISSDSARFQMGNTTIWTRLIDGTFPDYQRAIPTGNANQLRVDVQELLTAIKRVSVISAERGRAIKITVRGSSVEITVNNPGTGTASMELLAIDSNIDETAVGVNAIYLSDVLERIDGYAKLSLGEDSLSPIIIEASGRGDSLFALMPMRV